MAYPSIVSRSNFNLEMLVFAEGGKPEKPAKTHVKSDAWTETTEKLDLKCSRQLQFIYILAISRQRSDI